LGGFGGNRSSPEATDPVWHAIQGSGALRSAAGDAVITLALAGCWNGDPTPRSPPFATGQGGSGLR